jgi:peptide/nickel transport system substrate-binding protein
LTAEDVAYTIQQIQNPILKSPKKADWNNVTVNIISPNEIQFVLKQPYSPFITNTTVGILPKHIWGNISEDQFIFSDYNIEPIGSGPYQFESIKKDSGGIPVSMSLSISNKYYGKKPYINNINFSFYSDEEKAIEAVKSGHITSLSSISPYQAEALKEADFNVETTPLPRIFGIFFNQNNNPILTNKEVRQALDLAIDRKEIIDQGLNGYGIAITGPLPLSNIKKMEPIPRKNIALAKSLLEKNGWVMNKDTNTYEKKSSKNSLQVLSFDLATADTSDLKKTAEILKDAWAQIGANVDIKIFDSWEI